MKRPYIISIFLTLFSVSMFAQNDSIVERNVTVEREFTPTIQSAGKIATKPDVYTPVVVPQVVTYTDFNKPITTDFSFQTLPYADMNFVQPKTDKGFLRGGVGVWNTLADFHYQMSDKNDIFLDVDLSHQGVWGNKRLADTGLGLNFNKLFYNADLFVGVDVENTYFNYYGRYYNDSLPKNYDFTTQKTDSGVNARFWDVNTKIGVRSLPNADVQYLVQTGYEAFNTQIGLTEHQIKTMFNIDWETNYSRLGAQLSVQNLFYGYSDTAAHVPTHHIIKFQPYYAYVGRIFRTHIGVNLDMSLGKGHLFRPSPNIDFELKIAPEWLILYGGVIGEYRVNTLETTLTENRYLQPQIHLTDTMNSYTPFDAFLGLKLRPQANLLINAFVDYAWIYNQYYYQYTMDGKGVFSAIYADTRRLKVGCSVSYHYQDIVDVSVSGAYNNWNALEQAYAWDRAAWEGTVSARVKVLPKLSVYTDTYLQGKRYAALSDGTAYQLKPVIDINLGATYSFSHWFSAFAKLNNIANNKHEQFYAYQVQGINFLLGVSWSF